VNFIYDPMAATGTVRQLTEDGDSIEFDLVQLGLGTLHVTMTKTVPGADSRIYESAPVTIHFTDCTREEIEQVRSP
jgi:hypothetical protein